MPVISFFWGQAGSLIEAAHRGGAKVLHTVASAEAARIAVDDGADAIVAQGWEAGGHVHGTVATMALVPAVVDRVTPVPVLAAGGIADGRGLAAAMALGAAGAWIGTRFLASDEAAIHPRYRDRLLAAKETDTVYGTLFDVGWPDAPHRTLRNKTIEAWEAAGRPPPGKRPREGVVVAKSPDGDIVAYQPHTPGANDEGDIDALRCGPAKASALFAASSPRPRSSTRFGDEARGHPGAARTRSASLKYLSLRVTSARTDRGLQSARTGFRPSAGSSTRNGTDAGYCHPLGGSRHLLAHPIEHRRSSHAAPSEL